MWDLFFVSVFAGFALLCIPSFVLLRALRVSGVVAAAYSPLVSIAAYSVLPIAYKPLGIACSWMTLAFPLIIAAVLILVIGRIVGLGGPPLFSSLSDDGERGANRRCGTDWLCLGLYVLVGVVVTGCVFVGSFESAGSFVQEFDNVHHINTVRAFVDSGDWSSLSSTLYPSGATDFPPPFVGAWFYPSAWHGVAALMVDALGVPVAVAANAANFLFCAVVLPTGVFLFMGSMFPDKPRVVFFGAFVTLAFVIFPWKLLAWGPLYPNAAAFSLLPAVLAAFTAVFAAGARRCERIASGCLFVLGLVGLVFAQTNGAIMAGVLLVPFCFGRLLALCDVRVERGARLRPLLLKALACVAFAAFVGAVWIALFCSSFMQDVVSYTWPAFATVPEAVSNVLLFGSRETPVQVVLGVLVIVGLAYTLAKKRHAWLAISYAIMCLLYVVSASSDGFAKQLLTGFWYTDTLRVGAGAVIAAIPLASIGLAVTASAVEAGIRRFVRSGAARTVPCAAACIVVLAFVWVNFFPGYAGSGDGGKTSAFSSERNFLSYAYGLSGAKVYGREEIEFIDEVMDAIPVGSVVLNEPDDGSVFAYGINGLNAYYRYASGWGGSSETEASKTVRRSLDAVALDPHVAQAVEQIGAEYLVKLDCNGKHDGNRFMFAYEEHEWFGIERIDDDTPGFEVVLSDGDMRLYRIVGDAKN